MVIGVTGGFGTGKTTVARMFARLGAHVIDADRIVHRLLKLSTPVGKTLVSTFGREILRNDGSIDRQRLARKAFASGRSLTQLNRIIHPVVTRKIKQSIKRIKERDPDSVVVVDAPLLFEADLAKDLDRIVVVAADFSRQLRRLTRERKITPGDIRLRISKQMKLKEKVGLADYVVDNNSTLEHTEAQVRQIWEEIGGFR